MRKKLNKKLMNSIIFLLSICFTQQKPIFRNNFMEICLFRWLIDLTATGIISEIFFIGSIQ